MKLRINPLVVTDLKVIRDYISEDNAKIVQETIEEIYRSFENLQKFPTMGANLSRRVSFKTEYRYLVQGNYITLYLVRENCVEIYRVINRHQDITSILFQQNE